MKLFQTITALKLCEPVNKVSSLGTFRQMLKSFFCSD